MKIGIKFQLRLPPDLKAWLEQDAQSNDRSMNGQVIALLRERMNKQKPIEVRGGKEVQT